MTSEEIFKESAAYLAGKLEERKNELVLKLPEIYITDVRAAYYAGLKSGLRHHSHDYLVKTEKLKKRFKKLLELAAEHVDECEVCDFADSCIKNSEGTCPFAWVERDIKDLIKKYVAKGEK